MVWTNRRSDLFYQKDIGLTVQCKKMYCFLSKYLLNLADTETRWTQEILRNICEIKIYMYSCLFPGFKDTLHNWLGLLAYLERCSFKYCNSSWALYKVWLCMAHGKERCICAVYVVFFQCLETPGKLKMGQWIPIDGMHLMHSK